MAKKAPATSRSATANAATSARSVAGPANARSGPAAAKGWLPSGHSIRDTVEAVAVAFILAFLFRTFEAEAFVIPTGSMAPTLMGQHKDLECPECHFRYQAGASSEADDLAQQRGRVAGSGTVAAVTCPLCRYTADVDPVTAEGRTHPTYNGDRILVSKFAYDFAEPKRWEVVVFKYPLGAETNYIKRLVGLPHETIRLYHGDLYAKSPDQGDFHRERRPPSKLRAMAQIVYDNDYVVDAMTDKGWPLRWQPQSADTGGWSSSNGGRSFTIDGSAPEAQSLSYRHFVPSLDDWHILKHGAMPAGFQPKPLLITDFYAYDTSVLRQQPLDQAHMLGLHWVGDLLVECRWQLAEAKGNAWLELIKGGRHFRCQVDCQSGLATLSIDGVDDFHPQAQTSIRSAGSYRVALANIDDQLTLWVNGEPINFDAETTYGPLENDKPQSTASDPGDLAPARIGSQNCPLTVSQLRLWRDLYYIATTANAPLSDYQNPVAGVPGMSYQQLYEFWSSPAEWDAAGKRSPFDDRGDAIFPLQADQFFMLGDNSPMSQDARLWDKEKFVSRELLVGEALMIFWPHSFNRVPGTSIPFPFFPNFSRMGLIR